MPGSLILLDDGSIPSPAMAVAFKVSDSGCTNLSVMQESPGQAEWPTRYTAGCCPGPSRHVSTAAVIVKQGAELLDQMSIAANGKSPEAPRS